MIDALSKFVDNGQDVRERHMFDNGYGVSIVRHSFSYGYSNGLFEVAVLNADGSLCYDTPITSDVCGNLTYDEVVAIAKAVYDLPRKAELID